VAVILGAYFILCEPMHETTNDNLGRNTFSRKYLVSQFFWLNTFFHAASTTCYVFCHEQSLLAAAPVKKYFRATLQMNLSLVQFESRILKRLLISPFAEKMANSPTSHTVISAHNNL
jgi:hypothetical protein